MIYQKSVSEWTRFSFETRLNIFFNSLDVNDNIPRCLQPYHRLSIPENFSIDKPLLKINGSDPDNGINGTVKYTYETNSTWPFDINEKTGEIYSKEIFDYESEFKNFSLIIHLEDHGIPIKNVNKNACQIEIYLEDINDNRPELIDNHQTKLFFDIHQSLKHECILLNITDRDSGLNGKIKYNLQSIESNIPINLNQSLFQLHQNGCLEILDRITEISLFKLRILLEDYGYPSQQNLLQITIAFGDLFNSRYSSFEKIELFFEEKYSYTNYFAFVFGLAILIITFFCLISIMIICLCIRQHRRRQKTAIISRNKILCSSSQQLTTSDSTVTSNIPSCWNEKSFIDQQRSSSSLLKDFILNKFFILFILGDSSSPESHTYKILHIPVDVGSYEKDKIDDISCDHGYHESYQTSSLSESDVSIRREYMVNQLPYFVTKCKTLNEGFMIEMNVDGSDEDAR